MFSGATGVKAGNDSERLVMCADHGMRTPKAERRTLNSEIGTDAQNAFPMLRLRLIYYRRSDFDVQRSAFLALESHTSRLLGAKTA